MAWLALLIAGCCEVLGVIAINRVNEKRTLSSYLLLIVAFGVSFSLLSYAMDSISMGTAYAVWTGIGTVGGALVGMFLWGESRQWQRFLFIAMILFSAVGLKLIA
ncbi:DMT family transporter [Paenibacillus radicibacter]|uniref:DMT family transporter n=1 Tax=Paenibacillus radicibacter TaxID=2972488 RepID=UPI00280AF0BB|nr:multidrug efflux SMR transporter [Paenibacillus radicibacter]